MEKRFFIPAILLISAFSVQAAPFTSVVVYGDSLSDNGNLFRTIGYPPPPYYNGRFSNGPVAAEVLAAGWGVPLIDFAVAGATSGLGNFADGGTPVSDNGLPGMLTLFNMSLQQASPDPGALYLIWGGANDFRSPAPGDAFPGGVIARAVSDLDGMVSRLESAGAQHLLVVGMPDLGLTPFYRTQGPATAAQATLITDAFNTALQASLPANVIFFDSAALLRDLVGNPAKYGLTNVTDACLQPTSLCSTPDTYLFWDDMHPTSRPHAILGADLAAAAVPEPGTFAVCTTALIVLAWRRRRNAGL